MDLFGLLNRKESSGETAKSRLKLVLIQDRLNCSDQVLEMLKTDILKVISNYMEIDEEEMDIQISQSKQGEDDGSPVFYANIPIKSLRKVGKKNAQSDEGDE